MTGLFRRLARQLVGPEPTKVHTVARLPFMSPAEPQQLSEAIIDAASAPSGPVAARSPPPAIAATRTTTSEPALPSAKSSQVATDTSTWTLAGHTAPVPQSAPHLSERTKSASAPSEFEIPVTVTTVDHRPPAAADSRPSPLARVPKPALLEPHSADAATGEAHAILVPTHTLGVDIPPPLVASPAKAGDDFGVHSSNPGQVRARNSDDDEPTITPAATSTNEATEVHVHIGRIEVTAVPETTPARSKPRAGTPPMSLEAYLAHRQRRRA